MTTVQEITIPDIGVDGDVDVIEVHVNVGDVVAKEDALITLESEKASMDVPTPSAGTVKEVKVAVGDKVKTGTLILMLEMAADSAADKSVVREVESEAPPEKTQSDVEKAIPTSPPPQNQVETVVEAAASGNTRIHASPAVRRIAREFGVDLGQVVGTGRKGRIVIEDVQRFVKTALSNSAAGGSGIATNLPPLPTVDYAKYGPVDIQPLSKIKKISGANLHRNWLEVPHITQFDEADITKLEKFRQSNKAQAEKQGFKLTPLVFIMKAVAATLKKFPEFNASLDPSGEQLVIKNYYHIGVAVDTPNGLMVPVIRDVNNKGFFDLAKELGEVSERARTKGLMPAEMQGSCFTISSLGGIGGTAFTPIVNVPDVAILGVSKSVMKPIYQEGEFKPRLMLPLSLSYDHRVIDGAQGARFITCLSKILSDIRNVLL